MGVAMVILTGLYLFWWIEDWIQKYGPRSIESTTKYVYQGEFKENPPSFKCRCGIIYDAFGAMLNDHGNPVVWTDGCCLKNGQPGASASIGVFWTDICRDNLAERLPGQPQTAERAEVWAAIRALQQAIGRGYRRLELWTDCQYVIDNMKINIVRNRRTDWRNEWGQDLLHAQDLRLLDRLQQNLDKVYWRKVKGHSGNYGNEMADNLAYQGQMKNPN